VLQVDVEQDRAVATDAFARARAASAPGERLNGLGDRAFQTRAGLFVARKDRFVLRIDPSRLPDGADRHSVAFAAAEAVMSCWKG
jgi:hypothetical protein